MAGVANARGLTILEDEYPCKLALGLNSNNAGRSTSVGRAAYEKFTGV